MEYLLPGTVRLPLYAEVVRNQQIAELKAAEMPPLILGRHPRELTQAGAEGGLHPFRLQKRIADSTLYR